MPDLDAPRDAMRPGTRGRIAVVVYEDYARDSRVRRHARALARAGWAVEVLAIDGPAARSAADADGVAIAPLARRKYRGGSRLRYAVAYTLFAARVAVHLAWSMRRRPPAVTIVNGPPDPLVLAALPVRLRGGRIVLDVHDMTSELFATKFELNGPSRLGSLVRWLEGRSYAVADGILTVHDGYRDQIAARVGRPVVTVLNSPDDAGWVAAGDRRLDAPDHGDRLVLGHHGTIVERFGIDLAVRAVHLLRQRGTEVELRILGDGDFAADVMTLVRQLEVADLVSFDRRVFQPQDVEAFVAGIDVGIAPYRLSRFLDEAVPVKVLEYLTLGVPVIGTPTRALRRVVPDDVVRYVPEPDPERLAAAIVELRDPAVRRRYRAFGRPVATAIGWSAQEARLLDWIGAMAPGESPARRAGRA